MVYCFGVEGFRVRDLGSVLGRKGFCLRSREQVLRLSRRVGLIEAE